MTAPTDAELDAMLAATKGPMLGCALAAETNIPRLIAALREARATISDLEDELIDARQPADDLEGALEILKVDNDDLRAQLAAARAVAVAAQLSTLSLKEAVLLRDGPMAESDTWSYATQQEYRAVLARLSRLIGDARDAAMALAPDAGSAP
jgi:chromosome segregation ATPase